MKVYVWDFAEKDFDKFAEVVGRRAGVIKAIIDNGEHAIVGMTTNQERLLFLTRDHLIATGIEKSHGFSSQLVGMLGMPDFIGDNEPVIYSDELYLNNWAWENYPEPEDQPIVDEMMFNPARDLPIMREFLGLPPEEPKEVEETEETEVEPETRPLKRPTRPRPEGKPRIPRNQK